MKKYSKLLILVAILAVVIIAIFAVKGVKEEKERIRESDEVVLRIPPESVSAVSWTNESGTFGFHRTGEGWKYDADDAFPVDDEKMAALLSVFEEFGASFTIDDIEDYAQYGLKEPVVTVHLTAADGTHDISMGEYSTMDQQRYVSTGDGKVYLVKNDPAEVFSATLTEIIKNDRNLDYTTVSKIVSRGDVSMEILEKDYEETSAETYDKSDIYFLMENGKALPLDSGRVKNYLAAVSALDLRNYASYNVSAEELKEFGLDEPELTVTIDYAKETPVDSRTTTSESGTYSFSISRTAETVKKLAEEAQKPETDEETEASEAEEGEAPEDWFRAYVRIGDSRIVYPVTRTAFDLLYDLSYDALRHKKVFSGSMAGIHTFDITLDGEQYLLTSETDKKDVKTFYYKGEPFDVNTIQTSMAELEAEEFTEEEPDGKLEIGVKLLLDNPNYPEVTFELYRYDGMNMLAKVNGRPFGLIPRTKAIVFMESIYRVVLGQK